MSKQNIRDSSPESFSQTPYAIVTPARDEEKHIGGTIEAVVAQTIRPVRWVIVNDGSSDCTGRIAERYAREYPWISVIHRQDRGRRQPGGGVVDAFYDGYRRLAGIRWKFVVKLDADLTFPPDYFQRCFEEFDRDRSLGIGGGALFNVGAGVERPEPHPDFHVRGATKIYRQECWDQIKGLWTGAGWDTIDEVKANMLGWNTRTFSHIRAFHHRMTGAAEGGWRDNMKNGQGSYVAGYHPLYLFARCLRRVHRKPYLVGSVAMLYGFMAARWKRQRRIDDPRLIAYIQQQQMNQLLGRPTVWK